MRGLHQQGADIFHWSVERLRHSVCGSEAERQRIIVACLAAQGHCVLPISRERARELARESGSTMRGLVPGRETILALKLMEELAADEAERLRLAQEALAIARASDSGWWLPKCMMDLGNRAIIRGDIAEARELITAARATYRATGNPSLDIQALLMLSEVALLQGDYAGAQRLGRECLALAQEISYTAAVWWSHFAIAEPALLAGDLDAARSHYQQALTVCHELDDRSGIVYALCGLGRAACAEGEVDEARRRLGEALQRAHDLGDRSVLLEASSSVAWALARRGRAGAALQLLDHILRQPESSPDTRLRAGRLRERVVATLAPEAEAALAELPEELGLEITLGALLAELGPPQPEGAPAEGQAAEPLVEALTERELEVLRSIAEGLSNYDIATRMFVGVSTIKTHINHLYGKLGVRSRTQAVARARALRLL